MIENTKQNCPELNLMFAWGVWFVVCLHDFEMIKCRIIIVEELSTSQAQDAIIGVEFSWYNKEPNASFQTHHEYLQSKGIILTLSKTYCHQH